MAENNEYTNLMQKLNPAQREAVCATEGYVRVIAGAGSGKTRALSHRFAFLVNELGILPGNILCVTFTNKSANEMRHDTGYINTFHGFCVSVLQEDSYAAGYPKSFLVLDNSDIDAMLQIIYEERGLTLRDMTFSMARDMIEIQKLFKRPEYYKDMIALPLEALKEKYDAAVRAEDIIFFGYLYQEKKCFGLDYNDLIKFTLHIFKKREDIRLKWQQRLEYIMIDEFQDIDALQYELMEALCAWHRNLFVVGDPDQTIYSWRGADGRFLMDFAAKFPGTRTIMMMENYRSTPEILAAANSLIEKNKYRIQKELLPHRSAGAPVVCHFADTQEGEAKWICEEIRRLQAEGVEYADVTLLYRAHYVTRAIEQIFLEEKIPYTIYSGVQFFDRTEIKDALSYLRMIAYKDDLSFRRIVNAPKRNMGKRRLAFLEEYAAQHGITLYQALTENLDDPIFKGTKAGQFVSLIERYAAGYEDRPVSEILAAILNESGYEKMLRTEGSQERLDNVAELKQSVYEYETTCGEEVSLPHYLAHVALFTNADGAEAKGKVKLMTVHAAKGPDHGSDGRRAAAGFCSHDPRQEQTVFIPGSRSQLRRLTPVSFPLYSGYRPASVPLHERAPGGTDQRSQGIYRLQPEVHAGKGKRHDIFHRTAGTPRRVRRRHRHRCGQRQGRPCSAVRQYKNAPKHFLQGEAGKNITQAVKVYLL